MFQLLEIDIQGKCGGLMHPQGSKWEGRMKGKMVGRLKEIFWFRS